MAFNNYLEDENDKPYFTTNSLAYYYDKMEGFAKAVEGSAKALNLTKEEVEKRLTLYIEQNKNELDQRLAQWDGKLETFDSSVETLLTEWVDDGTLTHVIDSTLIDQKIAPVTAQLEVTEKYLDIDTPTVVNEKISNLFRQANEGLSNVTYIMSGDSTRASNGAHIYSMVSPVLQALGINTILQARSGLKAQHWGSSSSTVQPGFPQASELISQIPGTGATTVIDICLGINDNVSTVTQIKGYIKAGIDLIKASKPDVLFNLTSPNIRDSTEFYKLPIVFRELTTENGYGYINVSENVWKSWSEATGYFLDADHPNELGQKKMAEYILSKLVPEDLRLSYLSSIPVPKGKLSDVSTNEPIKASGFRIEAMYTTGTSTGVLYLRKLADNRWYLFDALTGDSITSALTLKNGKQTISNGFLTARKLTAMFTIKDYTVLENTPAGTTFYPLTNFLVSEFTKNKTANNLSFELMEKLYEIENPYIIRKGHLTEASVNNPIRDSGIRVEVVYSVGSPTGSLFLNKGTDGKWSLFETASGSSVSAAVFNGTTLADGEYNVGNGYVAGKTISAKVFVKNASPLNAVVGSATTFYPIKNGVVTSFSTAKSLKEHVQAIYDLFTF